MVPWGFTSNVSFFTSTVIVLHLGPFWLKFSRERKLWFKMVLKGLKNDILPGTELYFVALALISRGDWKKSMISLPCAYNLLRSITDGIFIESQWFFFQPICFDVSFSKITMFTQKCDYKMVKNEIYRKFSCFFVKTFDKVYYFWKYYAYFQSRF